MVRPNTASSRWRRAGIRLLASVLIGVLCFGGWKSLFRHEPIQLTFAGTLISQPDAVLQTAERHLADVVYARHGQRSEHTRCYYMTAARTLSGRVAVIDQLACGPVLFVDGDSTRPYLTFELQQRKTTADHIELSVSAEPSSTQLEGEAAGRSLVRPDGSSPPAGLGGLRSPTPPQAIGDVLTKTSAVSPELQTASETATLMGRTSGVRLRQYGFVDRYGSGDQARSAPRGRRLLAFSVAAANGESGNAAPDLSVRVDNAERGPLVNTTDFVVVAVPTDADNVDLVLTDSGVKQSISLLTGQPSSGNPAVTTRTNRTATLAVTKNINIKIAGPAGSGITSGRITFTGVSLSYWSADGSHASRPDRAFLHVMATVRLDGDSHDYGVEAGLLAANATGGPATEARNSSADNTSQIDDVIEVPADIVDGTITYSGTVKASKGTMTVVTPVTVPFRIPVN
jgi:hypothetical protein